MLAQEIIRKRRLREKLAPEDIRDFVCGMTTGDVSGAQIAAFCMATCLQPMMTEERAALTRAMAESGTCIDWSRYTLDGPVLDKHSTGGVGDKTSLIVAPIVAACGAYVPMIAGRSLGHTGGTLDKLDAIPGYVTRPALDSAIAVVRDARCAIFGATSQIAPADRRMYEIRDVTATIASPDLITASILSKKIAAGVQGLVLDVKTGSGAFMEVEADSVQLAESLVRTALSSGIKCTALVTDMNQCLGQNAGAALEIVEVAAFLRGDARDPRMMEVVLALSADLLVLGGLADNIDSGRDLAAACLNDGRAAAAFESMVAHMGGPSDFLSKADRALEKAPVIRPVLPPSEAVVEEINVRALGFAIVELGGGRRAPGDIIDPAVGLEHVAGIGESVGGASQRPLCLIHARTQSAAEKAEARILSAFDLGPVGTSVTVPDLIRSRVRDV